MDSPEKNRNLPRPEDYGAEVLCAGWNPMVCAVIELLRPARRERIDDPAAADAETFLVDFYRYQG